MSCFYLDQLFQPARLSLLSRRTSSRSSPYSRSPWSWSGYHVLYVAKEGEKKKSDLDRRNELSCTCLIHACMHASWSPSRYMPASIEAGWVPRTHGAKKKTKRRAIERPNEKEVRARSSTRPIMRAREKPDRSTRPGWLLAGLSSTDRTRSVLWRARLAGRGALHPSIFYFLFNSDSALDLYTK
jgi:hypothetical protein